jgi:hypothetical protein
MQWTFITTIISFILLLYSTIVLAIVAKNFKQSGVDGKGEYRAV